MTSSIQYIRSALEYYAGHETYGFRHEGERAEQALQSLAALEREIRDAALEEVAKLFDAKEKECNRQYTLGVDGMHLEAKAERARAEQIRSLKSQGAAHGG